MNRAVVIVNDGKSTRMTWDFCGKWIEVSPFFEGRKSFAIIIANIMTVNFNGTDNDTNNDELKFDFEIFDNKFWSDGTTSSIVNNN